MSQDDETHYLLSQGTGESLNEFNYKLGQQPVNWIRKGFRLRRDALIFYKNNEADRLFIFQLLEEGGFNFTRFYRWDLQDRITKILDENPERSLPDFDTYYLLSNLAFENLLKGLWLAKHVEHIGFKKLPKEIDTHNAARLANILGINLSAKETELLEGLYDQFQGYGRYPIKKNVKPELSLKDADFGERNFDSVCIDCIENPYQIDKDILEAVFNLHLKPLIEDAFAKQHEHMEAAFKFGKSDTDENE